MKMTSDINRFGISLSEKLMNRFDVYLKEKGYVNRSEALRDLIRNALVQEEWEDLENETVASLTLLYDHNSNDISDRLSDIQHLHHNIIISSLHVHLDENNCLEILVLKGMAKHIKELSEALIGARGVRHGGLVRTTKGENLP
jgi:CopG family transcriptional regulator, nickel-responsive regulator